jgi:serine/threonine-protein kinase
MENLFQGDDDQAGPSKDLRVVTILEHGVKEAQGLTADPTMQADFYQSLGTVYQALGQFDRADSLLESALTTRRSVFGAKSKEAADTLLRLGALRLAEGQLPEAERLAREAIAINQRQLPETELALVESMTLLGEALEQRGAYDQTIQTLNAAAALLADKGHDTKELTDITTGLANVYFRLGDYSRADSLNKKALSMDRVLYGEHHPDLADDFINLGHIQTAWGHYPEAEKLPSGSRHPTGLVRQEQCAGSRCGYLPRSGVGVSESRSGSGGPAKTIAGSLGARLWESTSPGCDCPWVSGHGGKGPQQTR